MYSLEKKALGLAVMIMTARIFGLFLLLPVFAIYAQDYPDASASWIGLTLGIYGLTQAVLQLPMGWLSDYIGRRPVIILGLIIFILGAYWAAQAETLWDVFIGRALQGAGAIGSTVMAWIADQTNPDNRTKAMAILGAGIAAAFGVAMLLAAPISSAFGLSGIFYASALLAGVALLGLLLFGRGLSHPLSSQNTQTLDTAINWPTIAVLCFSVASLHACMSLVFITLPVTLMGAFNLALDNLWVIYLSLLGSAALSIILLHRRIHPLKHLKAYLRGLLLILTGAVVGLQYWTGPIGIWFSAAIFFSAFTLLESVLPSWLSRLAPLHQKGKLMGIYSTAQFMGVFIGGAIGGILQHLKVMNGTILFVCSLTLFWLAITHYCRTR